MNIKRTTAMITLFAVLLTVAFIAADGSDADPAEGQLGYQFTDGDITYRVTKIAQGGEPASVEVFDCAETCRNADIPSVIRGYRVTSVAMYAFAGCSQLETFNMHGSVTSLNGIAFTGCSSLRQITVTTDNPNYASYEGIMYSKDGTVLVAVPNVYGDTFYVNNKVGTIGPGAFSCCSSLKKVNIPNNVMTISQFDGASSLQEIYVQPGNPKFFSENGVLFNADRNFLLDFPEGRTGHYTIPANIQYIKQAAFSNCSLTSVKVSDNVKDLPGAIFLKCRSLTSVQLPDSIRSIGASAFNGCESMESFEVPSGTSVIDIRTFLGCRALKTVTLHSNITSIGERAFFDCSSLDNVYLPDSVTAVAEGLFQKCTSLKSVRLPAGSYPILPNTFDECTSLKSVMLPEGVTSIGMTAFFACTAMESLIIPSSVSTIGWGAFEGCTSLAEVRLCTGLHSIGDWAFASCTALSELSLPSGLMSLGDSSFVGCESLVSMTLDNELETIGARAFLGCKSLESMSIPSSVTGVGANAFLGCDSLTDLTVHTGASVPSDVFGKVTFRTEGGSPGSLSGYHFARQGDVFTADSAFITMVPADGPSSELLIKLGRDAGAFPSTGDSGTMNVYYSDPAREHRISPMYRVHGPDTLYVEIASLYKVSMVLADGSFKYSYFMAGETMLLPTPFAEGRSFEGWYTDEALTVPLTITVMPAEDLMLYSKWAVLSYDIRFDTGTDPVPGPVAKEYGSVYVLPDPPVREGYEFLGWKVDSDTELRGPGYEITVPAADVWLHAVWEKVILPGQETVIIEAVGGTVDMRADAIMDLLETSADPDRIVELVFPGAAVSIPLSSLRLMAEDISDSKVKQTVFGITVSNEATQSMLDSVSDGYRKMLSGSRMIVSVSLDCQGSRTGLGDVIVTVPYEVQGFEDPSLMTILHISDDGTVQEIIADYDGENKQVSFMTHGFSDFAIAFNERPAVPEPDVPQPDIEPDPEKGEDHTLLIIAVIAVLVVLMGAVAVKKRR